MAIEMTTKNHELIALNIIRNREAISRTDLARQMKLSKPKITQITQKLIRFGLIAAKEEGESKAVGGRKPILLALNRVFSGYVIGVDIGTSMITVAVGTIDGNYSVYAREKTVDSHFPIDIVNQVTSLYWQALEQYKIDSDSVLAAGVSIGGLVDAMGGHVIHSPNFNWEKLDLGPMLESKLSVPVFVENCTKAMAVGDIDYKKIAPSATVLYLNHGFGVGSAIMKNRHSISEFCEIGHMTIPTNKQDDHVLCYCGNENCLETKASGWAIQWKAQNRFDQTISPEGLATMADEGDKVAQEIFSEVGEAMGVAIAATANMLALDHVIISGGVSQSNHLYHRSLIETFNSSTIRFLREKVTFHYSECKSESAVKGMVKIALSKSIFSQLPLDLYENNLSSTY